MDKYTEPMREAAFEYGIKRLAADLDMTESRLYKKLDSESNLPMTLNDFFRVNRVLKNVTVIQPLLNDLGLVATPRAEAESTEECVFRLLAEKQVESGRLAQVVVEAMQDRQVSDEELSALEDRLIAAESALAMLRNRIRAMNAQGKGLKLAK